MPDTARIPPDRNELGSLHKGLQALLEMNRHKSMTASSLAAAIGVSRTSARRILDTLVTAGVVDKVESELHYRLAPAAADLSRGLTEEHVLSHVAAPLLYEATHEIGWALSLVTVADGDMVLEVSTQKKAPYAITFFPLGSRVPILESRAGKLAMAYMPDAEREALIARFSEAAGRDLRNVFRDPHEAEEFRKRGFFNSAGSAHQDRESHLYVPVFMEDRVPGCLIMRYLISAVPHADLEGRYVPLMQRVSARITTEAVAAMENRLPAWAARRLGAPQA